MVDIVTQTIKTHKKAGLVLAVDRIHVEQKTQEDNNDGTPTPTLKNIATNAETKTVKITYNPTAKGQDRFKMRQTRVFCKRLSLHKRYLLGRST